jgi:hypothetical protein
MARQPSSSCIIKPTPKAQTTKKTAPTNKGDKGKKCVTEDTEQSQEGNDQCDDSDEDEDPQKHRKKRKTYAADSMGEETIGSPSRKSKHAQKKKGKMIEHVDDNESDDKELEVVDIEADDEEHKDNVSTDYVIRVFPDSPIFP